MIGSSPAMVEIYKTVSRVAPTDATVIIEGETGTGKELVARMIHRFSQRATQPFVPVDCASIAPSLLESELFGAMRGAFTGADRDRVGVFEAANRGTVFLDEIGDIELNFQLKLLRFLQERRDPPGRRLAVQGGGCARDRGHQPRSAAHGGRGQVPRGPLVPPERGAHRDAAAARAARRHPAAGALLRQQIQRALQPRREADGFGRARRCRTTPGPATCGSCST